MEKIFINEHENYSSAVLLSSATNNIITSSKIETYTYRTYLKPREYGNFTWSFWHSNAVDSTWDNGLETWVNLPGGEFRIDSSYIADGGTNPDGSIVSGTQVQITFGGNSYKDVLPKEKFWSDNVQFNIPENHYLVFTWTITNKTIGKTIPYNCETNLASTFYAPGCPVDEESGNSFEKSDNMLVMPALIAYKKTVQKRITFWGDSITQGVRNKIDAYEYWAAKIGQALGVDYSIWNIGSGWARAKDAATDGVWAFKAKQCDEIIICFGVNDIGTLNRTYNEVISDLATTINFIKRDNPETKIILCTVPPFNFIDNHEHNWRKVNEYILSNSFKNVDCIFDIASVLSEPAPNNNLEKKEYHSAGGDDPHPNGLAGTAVANFFLKIWENIL